MFSHIKEPNIKLKDILVLIKEIPKSSSFNRRLKKNQLAIKHFINNLNTIKDYESKYKKCKKSKDLLNIKPEKNLKTLTNDEAVYIYEKCLSNSIKKQIKVEVAEQTYGICPICGRPTEDFELDHVLPKNIYSQFTITPINLVPICKGCNNSKGENCKNIFNPYMERIDIYNEISFHYKYEKSIKLEIEVKNLPDYYRDCLVTYGIKPKIEFDSNDFINKFLRKISISIRKGEIKQANINKEFIESYFKSWSVQVADREIEYKYIDFYLENMEKVVKNILNRLENRLN